MTLPDLLHFRTSEQLYVFLTIVLALFLWPMNSAIWNVVTWVQSCIRGADKLEKTTILKVIKDLAEQHELAAILGELVEKDGAGFWPPLTNHAETTWPVALRAYKEIYCNVAKIRQIFEYTKSTN